MKRNQGDFIKLCKILALKKKRVYFFLISLLLLGVILEGVSVGLIMPMLSIISGDFGNQNSDLVEYVKKVFFIQNKKDMIFYSSIFLLIVFSIKTVVMILISWLTNKFSFNFEANICEKIYSKIIEQPYLSLVDKSNSKLLQNFVIDSSILSFNIILPIFRILAESMVLLMLVIILFYFTFEITIILVPSMFILVVAYFFLIKNKIFFWGRQREKIDGNRIQHIQKTLDGIKEIKVSKFENVFKKNFNTFNYNLAGYNKIQNIFLDFPRIFLEFLAIVSFIFFIIFYLRFESNTENLIPLIGLVIGILFKALPSINRIIVGFQLIKFGLPVIDRIYSGVFEKSESETNYTNLNNDKIHEDFSLIEIKDLNYKYPKNNETTLENINLRILNKDVIGIYGESGSGKTTFLNIFLGLIETQSGQLKIDNKQISSLYRQYSGKIFYLPQNIFIFEDTIENNIALGRDRENEEENKRHLQNILELSDLTRAVEKMPNKEKTMLGTGGVSISGGQKQKIGIARALYDDPKILILDECTNALDKKTQDFILNSLLKIKSINLIIFVSHDLNSFRICNKVYKVTDKTIAEVPNV